MATEIHNSSSTAFAQAILELADERKQVDAVAGEIAGLGKAVSEAPLLASFFGNPSIKDAEREGVLNRALLPHVSPLVGSFLRLLLSKGKLGELGAIASAFQGLSRPRCF